MIRDEVLTAEEVEGKSNTELLSKHILELQKDKGNLTDKVKELEAQLEREKNLNQCLSDHNEQLRELIEKMKCCYNCEHGQNECYCSIKHSDICDLSCWDCGCDKWEIKEND